MALIDSVLNMVSKGRKEPLSGSRSEREAKIKDKAGLVINVFAALLAFNTFIGGGLSSTVMNNTIKANDVWVFYQAKSTKQTSYELAADATKDPVLKAKYQAQVARYESDPETGEGKKELYATAKKLEAERDLAKKKSPWIGYASTAYQLSIVLLSASILAVSMPLFFGSFVVAGVGLILMSQGLWLWI
jgi:L-fucose isomerase-like protein